MEKNNVRQLLLAAIIIGAAGVMGACTDNDYDLNEVDMTVGIGGGRITIPTSSSDVIPLYEVLKFNDSEVVDTLEGGDYYFAKDGDPVDNTEVSINKFSVERRSNQQFVFDIDLSGAAAAKQNGGKMLLTLPNAVQKSKVVNTFNYDGNQPDEVVELKETYISAKMEVEVSYTPNMKKVVSKFAEMSIELPNYMDFEVVSQSNCTKEGNKLVFKNVPTNTNLKTTININKLTMGMAPDEELGSLTVDENGKVVLVGNVRMTVKVAEINDNLLPSDFVNCSIISKMAMDEAIMLDKVKGRFVPVINLDDLGDAEVTGLPDFLTEGDVKIDIDNPQLLLTLNSNLTVGGEVTGVIKWWRTDDNGNSEEGDIKLPQPIRIKAAAEGASPESNAIKVCICRYKTAEMEAAYDQVIETDDISELLYPRVIDRISFKGEATADKNNVYAYELGKKYIIRPAYRVEAPLAFGDNAKIVYTETFEDWNEDVKDFDVKEGTYIELIAKVENRIPAYLNVKATPLDVNGDELAESVVDVDVDADVKASADGVTPAVSELKIVLTPAKGAFEKLNGLKLKVSGAARDAQGNNPVKGITLNANKHSLVLKDIKLSLVGTAVADLN